MNPVVENASRSAAWWRFISTELPARPTAVLCILIMPTEGGGKRDGRPTQGGVGGIYHTACCRLTVMSGEADPVANVTSTIQYIAQHQQYEYVVRGHTLYVVLVH